MAYLKILSNRRVGSRSLFAILLATAMLLLSLLDVERQSVHGRPMDSDAPRPILDEPQPDNRNRKDELLSDGDQHKDGVDLPHRATEQNVPTVDELEVARPANYTSDAPAVAVRPKLHYLNLTNDTTTAVDMHDGTFVVSMQIVPTKVCGRVDSETGEYLLTAVYNNCHPKQAGETADGPDCKRTTNEQPATKHEESQAKAEVVKPVDCQSISDVPVGLTEEKHEGEEQRKEPVSEIVPEKQIEVDDHKAYDRRIAADDEEPIRDVAESKIVEMVPVEVKEETASEAIVTSVEQHPEEHETIAKVEIVPGEGKQETASEATVTIVGKHPEDHVTIANVNPVETHTAVVDEVKSASVAGESGIDEIIANEYKRAEEKVLVASVIEDHPTDKEIAPKDKVTANQPKVIDQPEVTVTVEHPKENVSTEYPEGKLTEDHPYVNSSAESDVQNTNAKESGHQYVKKDSVTEQRDQVSDNHPTDIIDPKETITPKYSNVKDTDDHLKDSVKIDAEKTPIDGKVIDSAKIDPIAAHPEVVESFAATLEELYVPGSEPV